MAPHYQRMLDDHNLACIAVTDHNTIAFAQELHMQLGDRIIVGEEITTSAGEIIGLYLKHPIDKGLSLQEAVRAIKEQKGLLYIPHPFEIRRSGVSVRALATILADIDIVETCNGRAVFQNRTKEAYAWAAEHDLPGAASSDAHGPSGWGKTYSVLSEMPTRATLVNLLRGAQYKSGLPGVRGILYPKYHRMRKRLVNA
ncbi:MAG TPA: PHP-associated domain-containing protein [Patescibacteria group bacterium]|nr:PHP-associated domain-containing protein [Patescibacteria group bacterium]